MLKAIKLRMIECSRIIQVLYALYRLVRRPLGIVFSLADFNKGRCVLKGH